MAKREQWGTRAGFVLAAVGSAIGLGNIWRFPYMAAENGGGAFFIPYLFALLTAGIPILVLEFGIGHKFRGSAPLTLAKLNRRWEWLGWWQVLVCFFIAVYYVVIIAWAISYVGYSLSQAWGDDPGGFFFGQFLGLTEGPFDLGGLRTNILLPLLIAWGVTFLALFGGVKGGIEKANKILMPVLFIMTILMAVRGVTLPGAAEGLNYLFQPDFSKILDYKIWTAAYGQIFFTLSIAFGIMIAYSSYLPKKSDIVNNAFMTAFINCGFSLLAGIAVFGVVGHMALIQGKPVAEVAGSGGVGMAFISFPAAISTLGSLAPLFGILFFLSLTFAGLSSLISINEAAIAAFMDKFNLARKPAVIIYTAVATTCSLLFATGAGLYILDIVDHFINSFGIVFGGLIEVILIGWLFNLKSIQDHVNPISELKVGSWWQFALKIITPVVLGYMAVMNLKGDLTTPYGDYPQDALLWFGWVVMVVVIVGGFLLSALKWKDEQSLIKEVE
ncbi:NSS family neurotransmitter:Na+ symporter [Desulfohalotomaculum tongense]|uniref:sodium-dependent transporter n=1 Tax=Desulforadius tongensis TaxID=1216062 RepID=UPI00195E5266|nr:sodium-dependent transporter [Desulforadius tongensis]MBM7855107.1 NSS family neurotransmitter:Na+ symporter [Desulforadius tongensis]